MADGVSPDNLLKGQAILFTAVNSDSDTYTWIPGDGTLTDSMTLDVPAITCKKVAAYLNHIGVELAWEELKQDETFSHYEILRQDGDDLKLVGQVRLGRFFFDASYGADVSKDYYIRAVNVDGLRSDMTQYETIKSTKPERPAPETVESYNLSDVFPNKNVMIDSVSTPMWNYQYIALAGTDSERPAGYTGNWNDMIAGTSERPPWVVTNLESDDYYCLVEGNGGMHIGRQNAPAITWTAPHDGWVQVKGNPSDTNLAADGGKWVQVLKDTGSAPGDRVWPQMVGETDASGHEVTLQDTQGADLDPALGVYLCNQNREDTGLASRGSYLMSFYVQVHTGDVLRFVATTAIKGSNPGGNVGWKPEITYKPDFVPGNTGGEEEKLEYRASDTFPINDDVWTFQSYDTANSEGFQDMKSGGGNEACIISAPDNDWITYTSGRGYDDGLLCFDNTGESLTGRIVTTFKAPRDGRVTLDYRLSGVHKPVNSLVLHYPKGSNMTGGSLDDNDYTVVGSATMPVTDIPAGAAPDAPSVAVDVKEGDLLRLLVWTTTGDFGSMLMFGGVKATYDPEGTGGDQMVYNPLDVMPLSKDGWSYQYFTPVDGTFKELTTSGQAIDMFDWGITQADADAYNESGPYIGITKINDSRDAIQMYTAGICSPALTWTAPRNGSIFISGDVRTGGGDGGTNFKILKNGVEEVQNYQLDGWAVWESIPTVKVTVQAGDTIRFTTAVTGSGYNPYIAPVIAYEEDTTPEGFPTLKPAPSVISDSSGMRYVANDVIADHAVENIFNWYYWFSNRTEHPQTGWNAMSIYNGNAVGGDSSIKEGGASGLELKPGSSSDASLAWVAPSDGPAAVTGMPNLNAMYDETLGGVWCKVLLNGEKIWPSGVSNGTDQGAWPSETYAMGTNVRLDEEWGVFLRYDTLQSYTLNLELDLKQGDVLQFVTHKEGSGADFLGEAVGTDAKVYWNPCIYYLPDLSTTLGVSGWEKAPTDSVNPLGFAISSANGPGTITAPVSGRIVVDFRAKNGSDASANALIKKNGETVWSKSLSPNNQINTGRARFALDVNKGDVIDLDADAGITWEAALAFDREQYSPTKNGLSSAEWSATGYSGGVLQGDGTLTFTAPKDGVVQIHDAPRAVTNGQGSILKVSDKNGNTLWPIAGTMPVGVSDPSYGRLISKTEPVELNLLTTVKQGDTLDFVVSGANSVKLNPVIDYVGKDDIVADVNVSVGDRNASTYVAPGTAVTLTCATPGATIYYSLDNVNPKLPAMLLDHEVFSCTSGTQITINENTNLRVYAAMDGSYPSTTYRYAYYNVRGVQPKRYSIHVEQAANGTITSSAASVTSGGSIVLTFTPDEGYKVKSATVNGKNVTLADGRYTVNNVQSNIAVTAEFELINQGGGSTGPSITYYTITVSSNQGGKVSSGSAAVEKGGSRTFIITAEEGYEISDVEVDGKSVGKVTAYTFSNVKGNHTLKAAFKKIETPKPGYKNPFADVNENEWFYDSVMYAYNNGLMNGVSADKFNPSENGSRGMLVTVLYNLEGRPDAATNEFEDVEDGKWYTDSIAWAAGNNIISGYGNGLFGPSDNITREQMAVIFYRYAKFKGYDLSEKASLDSFTDGNGVSSWADEAMQWMVGSGMMNGKGNGLLGPKGTATRAEMAAILQRFAEKFKN